MSEALRPMSTGELLDRTFRLYKRHFLLFVGLGLPAPAALLLLILLFTVVDTLPAAASAVAVVAIALCLVGLLFGFALTTAATVRGVSALHLCKPTNIRQCYAELRGHYWRIVSVFLSVTIRMVGGSFLLYLLFFMIGAMGAAAASMLGTAGVVLGVTLAIAAFVVGILSALTLFVRYSMAVQACVVEDIPPAQAIKRSVFLAKGSRNRILTIYVLFSVISSTVMSGLFVLAGMAGALFRSPQAISVLMSLAFFLALLLTMPLATVALSLEYYDSRVRKEGFDLQLLIASLETPAAKIAVAP